MARIAILKTTALGDVLRTTSILPGLARRHPGMEITWLTARAAVDLVEHHPLVKQVELVDPDDESSIVAAGQRMGASPFDRVLSFDDERGQCALATSLAGDRSGVVTGAYLDADGVRRYTPDAAPWFDLGLLSVHGKDGADRLKLANQESHPAIFARMLGIEAGEPELPLPDAALAFAEQFAVTRGLAERGPILGLNTGAGDRWPSKRLPVEQVAELVRRVDAQRGGRVGFLLLGGPGEAQRNASIQAAIGGAVHLVDAGTDHTIPRFAGLVDRCDALVASDSLGMHIAIARRVAVVAFFAPTSAAEIELYGRGRKVVSTAADYCSYREDTDNSTITAERLAEAVVAVLGAGAG
jgi:heptosyltransferase-2